MHNYGIIYKGQAPPLLTEDGPAGGVFFRHLFLRAAKQLL